MPAGQRQAWHGSGRPAPARHQGQEFSQAVDAPGTFEYFCAIHPSMTGTVVVSEAAGDG